MQNYKMCIAYDGNRYNGFRKTAKNADKTIQGKLESLLFKLFEEDIEVISAVNTDAGVHADKQVINFKVNYPDKTIEEIRESFDEFLPDDIVVKSLEEVDERFHSRYGAKSIVYEYRIWRKDAPYKPLFERKQVNVMDRILDFSDMKEASKFFVGEKDFTAFSTKSKVKSPVKKIDSLEISESEFEIRIKISANGYLVNMERIIVGTLIQIGLGQRNFGSITKAFESKDRKDAGHKAMANGLTLTEIKY